MTKNRLPLISKLLPILQDWGEGNMTNSEYLSACRNLFKELAGKRCPHCGSMNVHTRSHKVSASGVKYPVFGCKDCKRTYSGKNRD